MNDRDLDIQAQKEFEFTQGIRKQLIVSLSPQGEMPKDKENQQVMLQAMRDMDAQNIQRLRVKVEDKAADNMAGMAGMVSQVLREINPAAFTAIPAPTREVVDANVKVLPPSVPAAIPVEGEMAVNPPQENYADFVSRMKS